MRLTYDVLLVLRDEEKEKESFQNTLVSWSRRQQVWGKFVATTRELWRERERERNCLPFLLLVVICGVNCLLLQGRALRLYLIKFINCDTERMNAPAGRGI